LHFVDSCSVFQALAFSPNLTYALDKLFQASKF
jgi:hypothetical protein